MLTEDDIQHATILNIPKLLAITGRMINYSSSKTYLITIVL